MKKTLITLTIAVAAAGAITSCDHRPKIAGSWTASAPTSAAAEIPAAATANALLSIDFANGSSTKEGSFTLSTLFELTQAVGNDSLARVVDPYEVSVSGTAMVKGSWAFDSSDDDDVLMQFDLSTVQIDIDPAGVAFSENMLTGAQQPAVDSLTARTAKIWQNKIGTAFKSSLNRFAKLDDVEVTSNGTAMKFEVKDIAGRDRDIVLHKVILAQ